MLRQLCVRIHHRLVVTQHARVIHAFLVHLGSRIVLDNHTVTVEVCAVGLRLRQSTLGNSTNEFLSASEDPAAQCRPVGGFETVYGALDGLIPPTLYEFREWKLLPVILLVDGFRHDRSGFEVEGRRRSGRPRS